MKACLGTTHLPTRRRRLIPPFSFCTWALPTGIAGRMPRAKRLLSERSLMPDQRAASREVQALGSSSGIGHIVITPAATECAPIARALGAGCYHFCVKASSAGAHYAAPASHAAQL